MNGRQSGVSYVEILIAIVMITVALIPMMEALQPGLQGTQVNRQQSEIHYALKGKLESVLAEPFTDLDAAASAAGSASTATSYSDLGAIVPHQLFIWRFDIDDADNDANVFTGGESDLLWLRIASVDGSYSIQTLLSPY